MISALFVSFLVAVALCVDSFVVSAAVGLTYAPSRKIAIHIALVFAFFQGLMPLLGALLGLGTHHLFDRYDHWVAFALLAFVGGKMIVDAVVRKESKVASKPLTLPVMALLGLATSIDAFAVGIGWGIDYDVPFVLMTVVVVAGVTFLASLLGSWIGVRRISVPERQAAVLSGIVLIGLGVNILCEHLIEGWHLF